MRLKDFRETFRTVTGRYDLVTSAGADNGLDFFVNAGQRLLDRLVPQLDFMQSRFVNLTNGDFYVKLTRNRAVQSVWIADSSEFCELKKRSTQWMRQNYYEMFIDDVSNQSFGTHTKTNETGTPAYYAIQRIGPEPTQNSLTTTTYKGAKDVAVGDYYTHKIVIIGPGTDASRTLRIDGWFYSPTVENDNDRSFWLDMAPETLIKAVNYQIESIQHANESRSRAMLAEIQVDLMNLQRDYALEQYHDHEDIDDAENTETLFSSRPEDDA